MAKLAKMVKDDKTARLVKIAKTTKGPKKFKSPD